MRLIAMSGILTVAIMGFCMGHAIARNTPCSGKKGGVARCLGEKFLCNDGSTSASKKTCSMADSGSGDDDGKDEKSRKRR